MSFRADQEGSVATKKVTAPPEKVLLYRQLLGSVDGVDTKANFGSAYTALNGNMYTMISKHGVVGIRLPEPERSAFRPVPGRPCLAPGEGVRCRSRRPAG